ncbi:Imm26 family immunity protein [Curtobacterium oceanosedimentum]|uniref:Imm26 family immunity protein n=1 Tax=Curtobacterium oceanosedimentum TaxID=465820 RepID=UPI0013795235|nr:Imm26 family immunity protein [Curtobacterium oceanosedimentum]
MAIGDVFTIAVDDQRRSVGQVVGEYKSALYVIIFNRIFGADQDPSLELEDATGSEPLFTRLIFDSRFRPGMWEIIGHAAADSERNLPAFTYGAAEVDGVKITNFSGSEVRHATECESKKIPRRAIDSPLILERAIQAHHGIGRWLPAFKEVRYRPGIASAKLFD